MYRYRYLYITYISAVKPMDLFHLLLVSGPGKSVPPGTLRGFGHRHPEFGRGSPGVPGGVP